MDTPQVHGGLIMRGIVTHRARALTGLLAAIVMLALAACSSGDSQADATNGADGGTQNSGSSVGSGGGSAGGDASAGGSGSSADGGGGSSPGDPADTSPLTLTGTPVASITTGSEFRFRPVAGGATPGASLTFSVANLPDWANFDSGSGEIAGVPQAGDVGSYRDIVVSVSDGQRSASTLPFELEVVALTLGSAELSWTAPTQNADGTVLMDLAGFRVYWGAAADELSFSAAIENPSVSMYLIENLTPAIWFFAVTAIDGTGNESTLSEVVSAQIT